MTMSRRKRIGVGIIGFKDSRVIVSGRTLSGMLGT
jgi:hypothetical protein